MKAGSGRRIVEAEDGSEHHFEMAEYVVVFAFKPSGTVLEREFMTSDSYAARAAGGSLPAYHVRAGVGHRFWCAIEEYRIVWLDAHPELRDRLDPPDPHRGCDEQGQPLDPNHPWNRERMERGDGR